MRLSFPGGAILMDGERAPFMPAGPARRRWSIAAAESACSEEGQGFTYAGCRNGGIAMLCKFMVTC